MAEYGKVKVRFNKSNKYTPYWETDEYIQEQKDEENKKRSQEAKKRAEEEGIGWDDVANLGKGLVAGLQQAGGRVADTALQASTVAGEVKRAVDPFKSSKQKDIERQKDVAVTEAMRKKLHEQKDITGKKIGGTSKVDEAARNIATGKASAEDIKDVGVMGLAVGADATSFINPAAMAARSTAGRVAKDVANNAFIGAIGGGSSAAVEDQDILSGIGFGALGGGALAGAGHALGGITRKVKGKNAPKEVSTTTEPTAAPQKQLKATSESVDELQSSLNDIYAGKYTDDMYDTFTADGKAVTPDDIARATQKQAQILEEQKAQLMKQADSATDVERDNAINAINQIDDKLAALKDGQSDAIMETLGEGTTRTLNPDKVRATIKDLSKRRDLAAAQAIADSEFAGQKVRKLSEVDAEIDNLKKGIVSDDLKAPHREVTSTTELLDDNTMPVDVRSMAHNITIDESRIVGEIDNYMTREKYDAQIEALDAMYADRQSQISLMPAPRQEFELNKLNDEYTGQMVELNNKLEQDAEIVKQYEEVLSHLDTKKAELLMDVNTELIDNPTQYMVPDEKAVADRLAQLEAERNRAALLDENGNATFNIEDSVIDENLTSPELGNAAGELISDTLMRDGTKIYKDSARTLDAAYTGQSLSSASHNLEKMFGQTGLELFGKIVKGYAHVSRANEEVASVLRGVKNAFGNNKDLYPKVVDVLEGKSTDTSMFNADQISAINDLRGLYDKAATQVKTLTHSDVVHDFEKRMADGNVKYTNDEIKSLAKRDGITVKAAEAKYKNISEFNNKDVEFLARERANNSTLDNYFPHLFDDAGRELEFIDPRFVKSTGNVRFGNMLHRMLPDQSKTDMSLPDYSKDIIDVSVRYFSALNKKSFLEPPLRELDNAKLAVKAAEGDASGAYEWLDKYQSQLKINKQDAIGRGWNEFIDNKLASKNPNDPRIGKNHYRSVLSTQRQINSLAALGLSFRNAIQQTTQFGTTIGNIGAKNTLVGMVKYLKKSLSDKKTHNEYMQLLTDRGITHAGVAREAYSDLVNDGLGGIAREKGEKLSDVLMLLQSKMDEFARGSAYEGALHDNLKKGMPYEQAETLATAQAAKYNFMTSKVDMPIALNGDTVRSLSQFMTFPYKQAEAWKYLGFKAIKNPETGKYQLQPKEMGRLLQMMAFYGVSFSAMSQFAGIDPEDNIPFYGNIFGDSGLPKSPIISVLFGRDESTPGLIDIMGGIINPKGNNDFEREQSRSEMFGNLAELGVKSFVPAGSQAKKSLDALSVNKSGIAKNAEGNIQFIQDRDALSQVGSTLFGKYSTKAGRDWITKGFPTLSEKQSEQVRLLDSEEAKKQYVEFYQNMKSVSGRTSTMQEAKDAFSTNPAKAERLVEEYNKQVDKAIQNYYKKYDSIPNELQEYLDNKVRISFSKIEES